MRSHSQRLQPVPNIQAQALSVSNVYKYMGFERGWSPKGDVHSSPISRRQTRSNCNNQDLITLSITIHLVNGIVHEKSVFKYLDVAVRPVMGCRGSNLEEVE
ncbi:MAG: hypothetical protein AMXMBFR84_22340 [Candidatus Hydrogenedentota bacterium]